MPNKVQNANDKEEVVTALEHLGFGIWVCSGFVVRDLGF